MCACVSVGVLVTCVFSLFARWFAWCRFFFLFFFPFFFPLSSCSSSLLTRFWCTIRCLPRCFSASSPCRPNAATFAFQPLTGAEIYDEQHADLNMDEQGLVDVRLHELVRMQALFDQTLKWDEIHHTYLLFNNQTNAVRLVSSDLARARKRSIPPQLATLLAKVAESDDTSTSFCLTHALLYTVTGVFHSAHSKAVDPNYCLTGDNVLKMLVIYSRLRCGVPVVLLGECGCGKTSLIQYLCSWLGVPLCVLNVHGGTTAHDIEQVFERAHALVEANRKESGCDVYVFLDEINSCAEMGLFTEVLTRRSLHGEPISPHIRLLAALNPYRKRAKQSVVNGLEYRDAFANTFSSSERDAMEDLVYKVRPVVGGDCVVVVMRCWLGDAFHFV
jgi:AAA domain (dynein-related subfamily)